MSEALRTADYEGAAASFASFLAGLAEIEQRNPTAESAFGTSTDRWDCDDLAEDVATIGGADWRPEVRVAESDAPLGPRQNLSPTKSDRTSRKSASVTLRLTQEESAQLQQRATAAGLTISAYVRSCVFEAEALRAQVKEALAQFSVAAESPGKREESRRTRPNLRARLFGHRAGSIR